MAEDGGGRQKGERVQSVWPAKVLSYSVPLLYSSPFSVSSFDCERRAAVDGLEGEGEETDRPNVV